jgi:hypothetical protein
MVSGKRSERTDLTHSVNVAAQFDTIAKTWRYADERYKRKHVAVLATLALRAAELGDQDLAADIEALKHQIARNISLLH